MATWEEISVFRKARGGAAETMQLETFLTLAAMHQTLADFVQHFNTLNPLTPFPVPTLGDVFDLADTLLNNPTDIVTRRD